MVTLDTYLLAWRERDIQNAYLPFFRGDGLANYFSDPVFRKAVEGDVEANPTPALEYFGQIFSDPSRTWDDLGRLCRSTRLPVLVPRRGVACRRRATGRRSGGGRHDRVPTMVDASSMADCRPSTPCPMLPTPWAIARPFCLIAASGAGLMCSKRSHWERGPSCSAGHTHTAWRSRRRAAGVTDVVAEPDRRPRPDALGHCAGCASFAEVGRANLTR